MRKVLFATQPIEELEHLWDMADLLALFGGVDLLMFASDWLHHDLDHPVKSCKSSFRMRCDEKSWAAMRCGSLAWKGMCYE